MSLKQIDLLLYVWLLINAIGWFGFLALPRLRKSLSCKEKADGIVEDIVETQNTKGQPLFHAVVRYQAGLASYACETANKTNAVWKKESLRSFIIKIPNREMHLSKTLHGQER